MMYKLFMKFLSALTFFLTMVSCTSTPNITSKLLSEQGFKELRPPSTLVPPGTFVEVKSEVPFRVETACRQEAAFGTNMPLRASDTQNAETFEKKNKNVALSASYLSLITGEAKYKSIHSIKYTLTNAKIFEIDAAKLFELRNNLTEFCRDSLKFAWNQGRRVSVIRKVIQADVKYDFEFDKSGGLSVEAKKGLIKGLSARLGADVGSAGERSVQGKSLFWGINDDVELACALALKTCKETGAWKEGDHRGSAGGNTIFGSDSFITIEQ